MKKFLIALLLLGAVPAMAQQKIDYNYSWSVDLINSDTVTMTELIAHLPIANGSQPWYDVLMGYVYIPDGADNCDSCEGAADSIINANKVDSAFVTYYTTNGLWKYVMDVDTCDALPCTTYVEYWMGDYVAGAAADTNANGYSYVSRSTASALFLDNIYIDVRFADSAGSGAADTMLFSPTAWFRLIEKEK